ncbi:hypothetical protein MMC17_006576 [Xylographa soralifera]|nr:hypothetical protein [Xylographa soralifera]
MSSAPACKNFDSMDFGLSHFGEMTAGQPPSRSVTTVRFCDWTLIPDICDTTGDAKDREIAMLPINAVDIISPSPRRQHRPRSRFRQQLPPFYKIQDTQAVDLVEEGRAAATKVSEQTPPSRPSPRRLPSPDLPDLDAQQFWPDFNNVEKCHGSFEGDL